MVDQKSENTFSSKSVRETWKLTRGESTFLLILSAGLLLTQLDKTSIKAIIEMAPIAGGIALGGAGAYGLLSSHNAENHVTNGGNPIGRAMLATMKVMEKTPKEALQCLMKIVTRDGQEKGSTPTA